MLLLKILRKYFDNSILKNVFVFSIGKTFLKAERKGLEMKILKDTCFLFIGSL